MRATTLRGTRYAFSDLKCLMAKASPLRSGDCLAGVAAGNATERVAAQMALADLPIGTFLQEAVVPYENDDVTRLIIDRHDASALAPLAHLTVGGLRDWLLSDSATTSQLAAVAPGLTPEMVAAVSKICRNQDLIAISAKCRIVTSFRNTIGLSGRLSSRLQPNHPTDDPKGILASIIDGLLLGSGDAVIGVNPAGDSPDRCYELLSLIDDVRQRLAIPTQSCVLTHVSTTIGLAAPGRPCRSCVSIDRRNSGDKPELWRRTAYVARGPRRRARSQARDSRQQCDVLRNRAGEFVVSWRKPRLRSTDVGSASLWRGESVQSAVNQHSCRLHWP